nr:ATP synthase F0 subunit 8 [Seira dowlingi]
MPQMSSLMWLILFLFFSAFYVIAMIKTYFASSMKVPSKISIKSTKFNLPKMNWKW